MKITDIKPMPYRPGELSYYQFIRGGIGSDYHQEPLFYQFEDGNVMMYWSAYDYDECSENAIKLFSVSEDFGVTWSDPQVFMADFLGGVPYFVHMLRLLNSDTTLMIRTQTRHNIKVDKNQHVLLEGSDYFKSSTRVFIKRSEDGGKTFDYGKEMPWELISGGKELPGGKFYGSVDNMIQLSSRRIVAAVTFLDPTKRGDPQKPEQHITGVCMLSDDEGKTWFRSQEISTSVIRGVMELQIAEIEPDHLFAMFRTKGGYVYQTESFDGGMTWSDSKPSPLTAPESMTRMIRLQSGNLLAVHNNVSSTTQVPRYPIVASLSKDNGVSWQDAKVIGTESGLNQLSNHGIIQLVDGRILLGISHYRAVAPATSDLDFAVFDEEWLLK